MVWHVVCGVACGLWCGLGVGVLSVVCGDAECVFFVWYVGVRCCGQ